MASKTTWHALAARTSFFIALVSIVWLGFANGVSTTATHRIKHRRATGFEAVADTTGDDLIWPVEDDPNPNGDPNGIIVPLPDNIEYTVEYNPITGEYEIVQSVGGTFDYRPRTTMTLDEYLEYNMSDNVSEYWQHIQEEESEASREYKLVIPIGDKDSGFGNIEIKPQGSAELTFGVNISNTENPRIPERQRRITTFNFDQKIQLNVQGKIGNFINLNVNYNTESTFDFENQMKLEYSGNEDQIIRKVELGNVSMPLKGTLIQGSSSLFGAKIETQWGKLKNTTVMSQQKGERNEINVQGGAQTQNFVITGDNYEQNRHYFLSNWFRDQYDPALASLPVVNSGVNITRIEVWVVNTQANTQDVRNVIAVTDMGEAEQYMSTNLPLITNELTDRPDLAVTALNNPSNLNNDIYLDMVENEAVMGFTGANAAISSMYPYFDQGIHYERVGNARKLNPSEFSYNSRLGFISLRQSLNNAEVLGVSYEYTLNGQTYQVGTLSQDGFAAPQALLLKMLKSSITQVRLDNGDPAPLWDLMMKNVYSLGAFGVSPENFRLDVWYNNPSTGVDMNYIPREPLNTKPLLQVLNLDRIDINQMPYPDGFFDFIQNAQTMGGLIDSQTGRIYFPVVEPFGSHLADLIREGLPNDEAQAEALISQIVYQPLYDSTKVAAQQIPALNRFKIKGQYQSASGSEISLNALNIPQGAVSVTAGGIRLVEGQDYTVDYNLGRVRIINEGVMASGQPIKVSVESNSLFNLQFKTMLGTRFDYTVNDDLALGATFLNLRERPVTQKVNMGDEPVNNTIMGLDAAYKKDSPFLTQLVDKLPFLETKAKSSIDVSAEGAYLIPGHSRAISKDGNAYLDDFEGSQSVIDIRNVNQWFMASTPKLQTNAGGLFPEGAFEDSLIYGYNRARLSWYVIDPLFFRSTSITPDNITPDIQQDHRMREVLEGEVFPNRQLPPGTPPNIATLDLTYYPSERGPYNYDRPEGTGQSAGLNTDGTLADPESRWGGIQRALTTTDFEASNIEFIQFWLMDPFHDDSDNSNGGELYFNLGNVSEDVLNDSQLSFENGLPNSNNPLPTLESTWGVYPDPATFNVVNAFDNSTGSYVEQDIGLDGLNSGNEGGFFGDWLNDVQGFLDPAAYTVYAQDPSADDYVYFRSDVADDNDWNTIERYKYWNNNEGNSDTSAPDGFPITATTIPNTEDINQDITLNTIESYFQYKVSLRPQDMGEANIGRNYITDSFETLDPNDRPIRWYQFKIPVRDFDGRFGGISDFRSIRYIRMFLKGWDQPVTLRFARLELVRGEWRKYLESLAGPQELEPNDDEPTIFNIAAVNIEENGNREPVPYVVPPGIIREQDVASANLRSLNEQSLSYEICNLQDGDARAAYRNVNFDMRLYKRLRMFSHIEALGNEADLTDNDMTVFIRLGSDFDQNYYEYELPMKVTPWYTGDDDLIWPEANSFDIPLSDLQNLKIERGSNVSALIEYSKMSGSARISIKGNPNLANVMVLMIGVRNPDKDKNTFEPGNDDGRSKCAIVWVNELRLSEFDEKGGWAAVARMNATLADFGTFAVAGNISKPGWGTLEQRVQERQQETIMGVDANSTLQLGKFFPENWGVTLPMYMGYSETIKTPRFSPLQPDIELNEVSGANRTLKKKSQDFTKRRSINFTNVRISPKGGGPGAGGKPEDGKDGAKDAGKDAGKDSGKDAGGKGKGGDSGSKKDHFYDIKNFSVSYSYNEEYRSDINLDWRLNKRYKGAFDYSFNNKPLEVKPFSKIGFVKDSKNLKWIKDFNFILGLKQIGFHTDMDRTYETSRLRNNTFELFGVYSDMLVQTQVMKQWNWTRGYTVKYDLTKSIKVDFQANNLALVTEPRGVIDKEDTDWFEAYRDTVWNNIENWGETTTYNHNTSVSYKLPLDKFPIIDFISSDVRYGSTFRWDRAPFTQDSLGNTIQNSRNLQLNAQANFVNLYNKVPLLKEINQGKKDNKKKESDKDKLDGFGDEDPNKEKKEKGDPFNPLHGLLRLMMTVQNVSGNYTRNEGILLPGYNRKTRILGMDENFEGPGWGFLFGQQNTDLMGDPTGTNYALTAAENGWLSQAPFLNQQYTETFSETWNYKINLEPVKHFKIELNATRTENKNMMSFFRFNEETMEYEFQSPMETGNLNASIITWPTAFINDDPDNGYNSEVFQNMLFYRLETSARLNDSNYNVDTPENNGYFEGWGPTSSQVVIPAFIAAYTGKNPGEVPLDVFATKAQPNWKVTYDGLTKIPSIKKYFKQFNLTHTYRSNITTNYINNLNFEQDGQGRPTALDQSEFPNFIPSRQINTVTITEQLAPFIGFDMTLNNKKKNDPQLKVEYKRDRTVALGLTNLQITETKSNSIVLGVGYKIKEVPNPFGRSKGSKLPIKLLDKTDINIRVDFTIRDNSTLIRKIVEEQNQVTAGQRIYSIKMSADMNVSDKLQLRFFYDHQINQPKISTSFPTSNISTGLSLRFSLNN